MAESGSLDDIVGSLLEKRKHDPDFDDQVMRVKRRLEELAEKIELDRKHQDARSGGQAWLDAEVCSANDPSKAETKCEEMISPEAKAEFEELISTIRVESETSERVDYHVRSETSCSVKRNSAEFSLCKAYNGDNEGKGETCLYINGEEVPLKPYSMYSESELESQRNDIYIPAFNALGLNHVTPTKFIQFMNTVVANSWTDYTIASIDWGPFLGLVVTAE